MWYYSSLLALAAAATVYALPQTQTSTTPVCNNSPSLCSRQYNKITYLGGHNSAFLRDESTGNSLSGNQYYNATEALDSGLRLLQAQVHQGNTTLNLCHTSCQLLDAGPLQDWLSRINDWMDANPSEVVTILLVNSAEASADTYGTIFKDSGIAQYGFFPVPATETIVWPTLEKMILQRQRLVSFVTNVEPSQTYPYILPEFDHAFETHFDVLELNGFNCTVDRPNRIDTAAEGLGEGMLSLVNHFKYQQLTPGIQLPDVDTIKTVNSPTQGDTSSLGGHINTCKKEWGTQPNFVLVDFFDQANPIEAVDAMNGLTDITGRSKPESSNLGSTSSATKTRGLGYGALLGLLSAAMMGL